MLTADVIIIGAGSSGSAVAYYLAKKGVGKIILLEKLGPGSGATGHAAGLIRHHYYDRNIVKMVRYCSQKFRNFASEMDYGIEYIANGFCYFTAEDAQGIEEVIRMQQEEGVNVELLKPEQVAHIHPKGELNVDGVGYGLYDHDGAYADPYKVAAGYCDQAKRLGAEIIIGVQVLDLQITDGRITKVITNKGDFSAGMVVNAAGLGAAAINESAGVKIPVKSFSLGHAVLIPDIPFEPELVTIDDASVDAYHFFFRPESGGTALLGMDQDDPNRDFRPETYYLDVPFDKMGLYYEHICKRMPFAANFHLSKAFGALDVKTPDWNPALGIWTKGPDNLFQLIAGSGHAFKLAPAFGKTVSEMILGEPISYDISCFDVNRLQQFGLEDFSGKFFIKE